MAAGMARALEMLKPQAPPTLVTDFLRWVDSQLMPQFDWFVDESDLGALHSNFHAAIVDAMTAVAVLSDDRARWNKARTVFHATVQRYLRWGKDEWADDHVLGETTETQRDIFHTQMGLAGLIQAAEMAWQQDEDWYSSGNYALAAGVELHARIVRAALDSNEAMLPRGFKFFESMPRPPKGLHWKFDLDRQIWAAHNATGLRVFDKTQDNLKYMVRWCAGPCSLASACCMAAALPVMQRCLTACAVCIRVCRWAPTTCQPAGSWRTTTSATGWGLRCQRRLLC